MLLVTGLLFFGAVMLLAAMYKLFEKAGEPGWTAYVPIYNVYQLVKIAGMPGVATVLFFLPLVNYVFPIYLWFRVARRFQQGIAFSAFNAIFPFFGVMYLGFSDNCRLPSQVSDAEIIQRGRRFEQGLPPAVPAAAGAQAVGMPNIAAGWQDAPPAGSDIPPVEAAYGGQPRKSSPQPRPEPQPAGNNDGGMTFGVDL
jgi:hypothetical protein